jgi:hypothetical protein
VLQKLIIKMNHHLFIDNIQIMINKLNQKKSLLICKHFGHHWLIKDYSNWMKENGDIYDFRAARKCTRCDRHEYLYDTWKPENRNLRYDIQTDSGSDRQIKELELHY